MKRKARPPHTVDPARTRAIELFDSARRKADAGETEAAIGIYREALELCPGLAEASVNLGQQLLRLRRLGEAERAFRAAVASCPGMPEAHNDLGVVLQEQGRLADALPYFQRAAELKPCADAYRNLGVICARLDRRDEAIAAFQKTLSLDPRSSGALSDLSTVYLQNSDYRKARECLEESLRIDSSNHLALNNLANLNMMCGAVEEAVDGFQKAMVACPTYADAHSNLLLARHYLPDATPEELFRQHKAWGEQFAGTASVAAHTNRPDPEKPLRIGFLSPDIRAHSVAYFLENILDFSDRREMQLYAYAEVARPDAMTERLRSKFAVYRSTVGLSDDDAAQMVIRDGIDILLDLSGHTAHNRLMVMARRPAPVQVTYLGYPDTTGIPAVGYRLTDELADPMGQERYYTEKLVRLPDCFLCYRPPEDAPPPSPSPCRSRSHVTFGSFNSVSKLNADLVRVWSELLKRVKDSRLVLKNSAFQDVRTQERYYGLFRDRGIDRERLTLMGWEMIRSQHLSLYGEVDICLDTFPYHGTTTTCEALWMGVPVVTRKGLIHASRVACSLLHQVGLDDLVAENENEYLEKAVELAADPERRVALRSALRERMAGSPLCDARTFTHHFEQALRFMWKSWCRKSERIGNRDALPGGGRDMDGAGAESAPVFSDHPLAGPVTVDSVGPAAPMSRTTEPCHVVEAALQADVLGRQGQRSKALAHALDGWTDIKMGRFHRDAPPSLLEAWQSPTLEGVLVRQCLALSSPSSYHDREHAKEWLLAWARLEPSHPEPFLRLGLLLTLDAALTEQTRSPSVTDALTYAARLLQDERSAKAVALCLGPLTELSLPYDGGRLFVRPDIRDLTTYVLLEQGDWFDEDLDLFRALVKPGMSMLDLGANVGVYSFSAAQRVGAQGRVASVESDSDACERMARTADAFPQWAVCGGDECRHVSADRIAKQLGGEPFDLIRIDTERYPMADLDGARGLLSVHNPVVFFNLRKGTGVDTTLVRAFRELGYESHLYVSASKTLVALDPGAPLDPLVTTVIAARPGRIEELRG